MIARGKRMFIQLASIGEVDDKGKAVLSFGFKGKIVAEPDKPFECLILPLIGEVISLSRYTDVTAMKADLATLEKAVEELKRRLPEPAAEGGGM